MGESLKTVIEKVCERYGNDRTRLMDIAREVQAEFGCVSGEAMNIIARKIGVKRVEIESLVTFYSFLSMKPKGKIVIRVTDDVIDEMMGSQEVIEALKDELGIDFGETTPDGMFTLEKTACIGMCDQAPAILVNETVVTNLNAERAREMIRELREHREPAKLVRKTGDGNNSHELVRAMVNNNIRSRGEVLFAPHEDGAGLIKALAMTPVEVIRTIKTSRLRGRGGAGFPTGMKWEFARAAAGEKRFVLCNADEGEPGTFKDRVLLTETPDLVFEGMTIGGYAIGATNGILYLRGEYAYLRRFLENVLEERRKKGFLGKNICGKEGFDFDIRIQMGAGAYVCGEETALISSCEGLRGDPKTRPPFPAQKGYLKYPTVVNNVETFCCVTRIMDKGAAWFSEIGSRGSPSTKLLSVSGDCERPGVYEVPFGIEVRALLEMVGAKDTQAIQIGGPSGQMIGPDMCNRVICYDDLATGGSIMIFNRSRDLLKIVKKFMQFFVEESCGYCTPCRVGNKLLEEKLELIIQGRGEEGDLEYLEELGMTVKTMSRCGLGQTSANPVLSTLKNFRGLYEKRLSGRSLFVRSFDLKKALAPAEEIAGRKSARLSGGGTHE